MTTFLGIRRADAAAWSRVFALWAAGVAVFGFVVLLLTKLQIEQLRAGQFAQQAAAYRDGHREFARLITGDVAFVYPTSVVVQFAAVGLAVIVTAWLGRRVLAFALPLIVLVASVAPSYWGQSGASPQPLGQDDWGYWTSLALNPQLITDRWSGASVYRDLAVWPLILGALFQTVLWLVPLVIAPARQAVSVPAKDVVVRAALPSAALALFVLALVPAPSGEAVYRAPLVAFAIGMSVIALATTPRPLAVRVTAAIIIPTVVAPIALTDRLSNDGQGWAVAAATAAAAVLTLALTAGLDWLRKRVASVSSPDEPLPTVA
jgi:hypothetical protein